VRRVALILSTAAVVAFAVEAPTGTAARPCWQALVGDWADGAISSLYPIHCYRQALRNMPEDIRLYSNASEDINRALAGLAVKRRIAGVSRTPAAKPLTASAAAGGGTSGAPFVLAGIFASAFLLATWAGYLFTRKSRGAARLGGLRS
jgi:hypothetical protein